MTKIASYRLYRRILYPIQAFIQAEAFSGILLIFITLIALIWANSAWSATYTDFWSTYFTVSFGDFSISKDLIHWINDGLMAIFFFVVGLEIKREITTGELASFKKASFPVMAALGGMLVPAMLYYFLNAGTPAVAGWGIPMATDIAFALGMVSLLGKRVPLSLKLFLVAFAIVDDIGAVLVIALFYTSEVNFLSLWVGFGVFGLLLVISSYNTRTIFVYLLLGVVMWVAFLLSGVHATIAGILLAITIPARSSFTQEEFISATDNILGELHASHLAHSYPAVVSDPKEEENDFQAAVYTIETNCQEALSPLSRLEHSLHPWVAFAIMPIFALANAGMLIDASLLDGFFNPLTAGIVVGLAIGKPVGIMAFAWLASVTGLAAKPSSFSWAQVLGVALLGGIGFTMSIFIANLAFDGTPELATAKLAILVASVLAAVAGLALLWLAKPVDK
ncbi:Na+/H+ antiporter NhaA [Pontibacter qinzhouensis]|uniref:Na(+)/H(+) antiporter NhaA n=1 Tax=Pontibacter qinzhouensis TaxID=2603253 RepID=A0A5C8IVT2_9BACT|nr:Na+/H+ antiporter NhaA [Pontibacter qinzhouensis]TXK25025.1 Na+/H+ antiporter NhaA [Pontibacter qinzhouensis]